MLSRLNRRLFLLLFSLVVIGLGSTVLWLQVSLNRPLNIDEAGYRLDVERGGSLSSLARKLAEEKIIEQPYALLLHSRLTGNRPIRRGEYLIAAGETARSLLEKLVDGQVIHYQVTFPEGKTYRQWLGILAMEEPLVSVTRDELDEFNQSLPPQSDGNPEGWLFPDTYSYIRGDNALNILSVARERMVEVLAEEWQNRDPGLPYDSAYEALIMASIIEKETALPEERGRIAGVFVRRLQKGIRLQTDPTVIYGLGDSYRGNLKRSHLAQSGPYNTYRIQGLPPTPIANPGLASIRAALHPEPGDSLYFVARGDGSHAFSATLEDHERAVRQYQLNRRPDYRSDPAPK